MQVLSILTAGGTHSVIVKAALLPLVHVHLALHHPSVADGSGVPAVLHFILTAQRSRKLVRGTTDV